MQNIDSKNQKTEQEINDLDLGRMRAGALITSNQQPAIAWGIIRRRNLSSYRFCNRR